MINLIRLAIINFLVIIVLVVIVGPKILPEYSVEKLDTFILPLTVDTITGTVIPTPTPVLKVTQKSTVAGLSTSLTPAPKNPTSNPNLAQPTRAAISNIATPTQTTMPPTPTQTAPTPTSPPNLASQVPSHNQSSDCWVAYNGGVYNITGYFGRHPGGDSVMAQACGRDITAIFNAVPHSSKAKQVLETYRI